MSDLISRQAALDAFGLSEKTRKYGGDHSGYATRMLYEIQDVIEDLQDAAPEIIQCKDCKHIVRDDIEEHTPYGFSNYHLHFYCNKLEKDGDALEVWVDDHCSFAERKDDERHDIQTDGD